MQSLSSMEMAKDNRVAISTLGEWYNDLLTIDSWVNGRSKAAQAQSLLCSKLQEREDRIKQRIEYLAEKRDINPKELWNQILDGTARKILAEEPEGDG